MIMGRTLFWLWLAVWLVRYASSVFLSCWITCFSGGLSKLGQASLAILCVHLVEDDVLPWQMYLGFLRAAFPHMPLVLLSFIVRLPIDLVGAALLYRVPVINEWFYPQLVKQRQLRRSKAMSHACVSCGE